MGIFQNSQLVAFACMDRSAGLVLLEANTKFLQLFSDTTVDPQCLPKRLEDFPKAVHLLKEYLPAFSTIIDERVIPIYIGEEVYDMFLYPESSSNVYITLKKQLLYHRGFNGVNPSGYTDHTFSDASMRDGTSTFHVNGSVAKLSLNSGGERPELQEKYFEKLLSYVIENMSGAVAMFDKEKRFIYLSKKYEEDFGLTGKNVIGLSSDEIFPNLPEKIVNAHQLALKGVSSNSEQDEIILEDRIVYNKWSCIPWYDSKGAVGGFVVYIEDITERVKLSRTLEESEKKLKEAQRIARMGNWELNLQTQDLYWSEEIYSLLGLDPVKFKPRYEDFLALIHPEDQDKVNQAFRQSVELKTPYDIIHRLVDSFGQIKIVQERGEITYDADGNPLSVIGTSQDITDAVESEWVLKTNSQYLNNLFTYANAPIIVWDTDYKITKFNKAFENYTGRTEQEVLGQHIALLFPPDGVEASMDLIRQTSDGERWETVEISLQHISGEVYTFIWNSAPIVDGDESITIGTIAQGQDITERKRAEEEIKALNQNLEQLIEDRTRMLHESLEILHNTSSRVPGMIFQLKRSIDGFLTFPFVSPGITELWGLESEQLKLDASPILEKIHPDDMDAVLAQMENSVSNPKPINYEYRIISNSGAVKWLFTNALTYVDEGNNVHWYGHTYDITNRKKEEQELILAKEEAEVANQAKSKFLSRMSHELRTPLNSILGFAQLMDLGQLPDNHKKSIDFILSNGRHLLQLINEVLDISAIESGNYQLKIEQVAIGAIVQEVMDVVIPAALKNQIQVSMRDSEQLIGLADNLRLKQVMMNLVVNAVKYNKIGGHVLIEIAKSHQDPAYLSVAIHDTGWGIAPEDIPKLCEPFQRLGAEGSSIEGSGLGLTIVKHLVAAMNGKLLIQSEVGKGSVFEVVLPIASAVLQEATQEPLQELLSTVDHSKSQKKVLYVEDNLSNLELVHDILETVLPSVQLIHTNFGNATLTLACQHQPQLILLDLDLPDIYGEEVLKQLLSHEETKKIPVIIISADAMPAKMEALLAQGAIDYIVKPLKIREFVQKITNYLNEQPMVVLD
jgi:PAS domain S-box-containing protein